MGSRSKGRVGSIGRIGSIWRSRDRRERKGMVYIYLYRNMVGGWVQLVLHYT